MAKRRDDTESRLRAAIFASPEDDAPRLVYADWLLDRGDPRGEFIQIQCKLGRAIGARGTLAPNHPAVRSTRRPPPDGEVKALERREQALLREHQKSWIAPIRGHINSWYWDRGFVHRIDVSVRKLLANYEAVLDFTPLRGLYLMGCTPALVRRFSESPLGSVRSLSMDQQRIGADDAEVFRSPHFGNLQQLSLQHNPFGDRAVAVLATSTTLGDLRELDLGFSDDELTSRGVESLSLAPFFSNLTRLGLDCSLANKVAIAPILERGRSLEVLELGSQRVTKQEAKMLAARGLGQ